jgi:hypothetical protein
MEIKYANHEPPVVAPKCAKVTLGVHLLVKGTYKALQG